MPAGLHIQDQSGKLLVDTNTLYYGLVKSGPVVNTLPAIGGVGIGTFGISVNAVAPVAFVEGGAMISTVTRTGNNWNFYISPLSPFPKDYPTEPEVGWPVGMGGAFSTDIKVYIFDLMRPNKSRTGLEYLSPSGQVLFNSDQWPLNIVASVISPPPWGRDNQPYAVSSGWTVGGAIGIVGGVTCSRSLADYGLNTSRRYAFHSPWSRGAKGYGAGDNFPTWECYVIRDGRIGFCWQPDPLTQPQLSDSGFYFVYDVHPNRAALSIIDVTDLPYPFQY